MTTAARLSPYASAHPTLSQMGYTTLPALPYDVSRPGAGKAPGHFAGGSWSGLPGWTKYAGSAPSSFQQRLWSEMPGANAGVVTGTPAGRDADGTPLNLVALDFDCSDPDDLALLLASAPSSPAEKRGRVGLTRLYRASRDLKSRAYDGPQGRLIDLLCAGRFCVVPPSVHPRTERPYVWTSGPVPVSELPILTDEDLEKLHEALALVGWESGEGKGAALASGRRGERVRGQYADEWAETNGEALARLSEWFHLLELPGARLSRSGVYSAIPVWRPSNSGRPTEIRKPNLSASSGLGSTPAGIRDFGAEGADASLTSIDLVQRALELTAPEAMMWLRDKLDLDDDRTVIDVEAFIVGSTDRGRSEASEVGPRGHVTTASDAPEDMAVASNSVPVELPGHLCRVPGLVGEIADWITATARKPQPSLSLAMALGMVGTVAGRKFCGPTQSATHLYLLCTGPTGSGKNAPKKAGAQLLAAAGLRRLIGPSSFTSASALIQHVAAAPASLCIMDEFSMLIGKLNAKNNSTHERMISGEMRQFWSLSFEEYIPPRWATSVQRLQPEPIVSPALSLIGLTTADELYSVLQGGDVVSGFLNRFLLISTLSNPLDVEPSADVFDPPAELVAGLQAIANVGGPLVQATLHNGMPDRPVVSVPWDGGAEGDARRVFKALVATLSEMSEHEALTQRCAEMAVRLATIRAIGISGADAKVTVDDMAWASDFALWSTRRLIADVEAHMVESDHQARAKLVLRIITGAPDGYISRTALCRKVNHRFDARTMDSVIDGLLDAGQIRLKESERRGAGRKASGYFAV